MFLSVTEIFVIVLVVVYFINQFYKAGFNSGRVAGRAELLNQLGLDEGDIVLEED